MLETDADRLHMLQSLGAVCIKGDAGEFEAIFDNEFLTVDAGVDVEGTYPFLTCRSSDVARLQLGKGKSVEVEGVQYRILRPEPDGTGMTKLALRK